MTGLTSDRAQHFYTRIAQAHYDASGNYRNAIRDFRILFEQLFKLLTETEGRLFSSLFQRTVYVVDALNLSDDTRDDIHGFRKFANKISHEDNVEISQDQYNKALAAVCRTIFSLSGEVIPADLKTTYKEAPAFEQETSSGFAREKLAFVRVTITKIDSIRETERGTAFFTITAIDEVQERELRIGIRDFSTYRFTSYHALLKPYRILHLTQLEAGDKPDYFFLTLDSLLILEPDFLLDVTDVVECFNGNVREPRLFLLSKFTHSDPNISALRGKLVNDLMDGLIENPDADVEQLIDEITFENGLRAAAFGPEAMEKVHLEIKTAFVPVLKAQVEKLKNAKLRIEPSFFSARYGLQGRLDVLEEFEADPDLKKVFELKSGKAPSVIQTQDGRVLGGGPRESVWPNHRMQVVAYHMLLRSAFGEHIRGKGAIFYPVDPHFPLRDVEGAPQAERELLEVRNTIVFYLLELAEGRAAVLNELMPGRMRDIPTFKQNDAETIEFLIKNAGAESLAYFKAVSSFVIRELHAAKTGGSTSDPERSGNGFASLWLDEPAIKEARFNILRGLHLDHFDAETSTVFFKVKDAPPHNFREGDIGILYERNTAKNPLENQMLRGNISKLSQDEIAFTLRSRQTDVSRFAKTEWAIEHDLYESGYWGLLQGLFYFLSADVRQRRLILGLEAPKTGSSNWQGDSKLFPNQAEIIRNALAAPDYFLIQGPPGTGKTSGVLVKILQELVTNSAENVVVLAYTNRAVREIARKLQQNGIPFELMSSREEDGIGGVTKEGETLRELESRLKSTRVFLATVTSFQSRATDIMKLAAPKTLIVDEASQLVEAQLAGILTRFQKWILIGDQKQLPAVVQQPEALTKISDPLLTASGFTDFRQSLFERLYNTAEKKGWKHAYGMLENHFRMHVGIAELINQHYRGKLKPGTERQQLKIHFPAGGDVFGGMLSKSRTLFIPSDKTDFGRTHPQEAKRVASWIRYLKTHHFKNESFLDEDGNARVGIITPFRAQISAIREAAGEELLDGITVDTVERFQGSERDIIILSLAVSDVRQMSSLQAVDATGETDRKLLVAISRARHHLIVLGYQPALFNNPHYEDVLVRIKKSDGLIELNPEIRSALDG